MWAVAGALALYCQRRHSPLRMRFSIARGIVNFWISRDRRPAQGVAGRVSSGGRAAVAPRISEPCPHPHTAQRAVRTRQQAALDGLMDDQGCRWHACRPRLDDFLGCHIFGCHGIARRMGCRHQGFHTHRTPRFLRTAKPGDPVRYQQVQANLLIHNASIGFQSKYFPLCYCELESTNSLRRLCVAIFRQSSSHDNLGDRAGLNWEHSVRRVSMRGAFASEQALHPRPRHRCIRRR